MNRVRWFFLLVLTATATLAEAQVNTVQFGQNRVQYQKFKWKYYQSDNFNSYFSQDGLGLGEFVSQIAEAELPSVERFVEFGLQRRLNIVIYNNYDEMQQSNIGMGIDWQNTGGLTKLVNNKMIVYYDGNREHLRLQIRQGIARNLVENLLLDDELRAVMLAGSYRNFYQFAFEKADLAGQAFWKYIADKYGKNKVTYFLNLARTYRNLNSASYKLAKKKFKAVLQDFMNDMQSVYFKDIKGRRNAPRGQLAVSEYAGKKDFYHFNANPVPRSFSYAVTEYKQGRIQVVLMENFVKRNVLLKQGVLSREQDRNPNYPLLAWDGKGTRLAVLYYEKGSINFFVYDMARGIKINRQVFDKFDQVVDMKYMLDNNTLILSAVRSGQSDIYVYKIDKQQIEQITNDIYDDLDPSFVAFPSKTGIIFSSARPNATARTEEGPMPKRPYNIFLVDNWNKSETRQISQLTNLAKGNARFPSQYNTSHFTFVSDENGIGNRYAGFFSTERAGLDTLVFIGDEVLRNPPRSDVDSVLKEWDKTDIDSVGFVSVTLDSAYVFPITNYQSSLLETRTAGDNQQVSEVVRLGDAKLLYRLKVDENALRRRNITARPSEYMRKLIEEEKKSIRRTAPAAAPIPESIKPAKPNNVFSSGFEDESVNTSTPAAGAVARKSGRSKIFEYRPPKFFNDYLVSGFNNNVLVTRYQPYQGGYGPIQLSNNNPLNGILRLGTSDLMEDLKFAGGLRISPNLDANEYIFTTQYLKKRFDYGITYYRNTLKNPPLYNDSIFFDTKLHSNLYQATVSYPFNKVRSLRINAAYRSDRYVKLANPVYPNQSLKGADNVLRYGLVHIELVHDDAISPALNIWNGLRYKIYFDYNAQIGSNAKNTFQSLPYTMNVGFDARHFLPIYRNITWAVRAAADFSWGSQKFIYYLGGVDNWLMFGQNRKQDGSYRYFDPANVPDRDAEYAFESLAVNLRGFKQNVANGNNALVINSEIRAPIFSSFFNRPINNAFLRNLQIVQFVDLGTAWNGAYDKLERPYVSYSSAPVTLRVKAGGVGPLAGGYGFGARSTLLGYFLKLDAAWQMNGFFKGKPMYYFAMGLDF